MSIDGQTERCTADKVPQVGPDVPLLVGVVDRGAIARQPPAILIDSAYISFPWKEE
jgi:hypothetical protein